MHQQSTDHVTKMLNSKQHWKIVTAGINRKLYTGTKICIASVWFQVQRDSQRWTHFVSLHGLNSKRRLNTRQKVGCGIPSSLLALRVDLRGLRSKLSWIRPTFSSDTRDRPELLPLHRQPVCSNWWFQRQMLFLVGGWMLKRRRNARCTAVADSVLMNSRT